MTPEQFCYWLQGFCELHGQAPTPEQWLGIKAHLDLVSLEVWPVSFKQSDGRQFSNANLPDDLSGVKVSMTADGRKIYVNREGTLSWTR